MVEPTEADRLWAHILTGASSDELHAAMEAYARRYAATELMAMADRLTKAHDLGPARRCRNRAVELSATPNEEPAQ